MTEAQIVEEVRRKIRKVYKMLNQHYTALVPILELERESLIDIVFKPAAVQVRKLTADETTNDGLTIPNVENFEWLSNVWCLHTHIIKSTTEILKTCNRNNLKCNGFHSIPYSLPSGVDLKGSVESSLRFSINRRVYTPHIECVVSKDGVTCVWPRPELIKKLIADPTTSQRTIDKIAQSSDNLIFKLIQQPTLSKQDVIQKWHQYFKDRLMFHVMYMRFGEKLVK